MRGVKAPPRAVREPSTARAAALPAYLVLALLHPERF
ncbi:potassium-transporting ATPase subunit F [Streptomyces sp. MUM 178J]